MRGFEIILMAVYGAMQNGTNHTIGRTAEIDGDLSELRLSMADENLKRREDTMPTEITVTSLNNMPYSGLKNINGTWTGEGYAFDILHHVQRKLNFTYTIIPPYRYEIGDENSGIMGQLYNKKVDMAVAFIPMLSDLKDLCTFGSIMDDVEISFMLKRPASSATGKGIFAPFSQTVWLCILLSWIIFCPSMFIIILLRTKITTKVPPEKYSLPTCIWFGYGALLKQGTTSEPVTNPTRLLFASWWIFITILTSFYTANLTAFLTLSEFTLDCNSAKELADQHTKWFALYDHTVDEVMKRNDSGTLKELNNTIRYPHDTFIPREDDYNTIIEQLNKKKLFLGDRYYIANIISDDYKNKTNDGMEETERCTYVMQPKNIYVKNRGFAYQKNSSILKHIDRLVMNLVEMGVVQHLRNRNVPSVNICPLNLKLKERQLKNSDLTMTYQAMVIGYGLAICLFFGEIVYNFCCLCKCCNRCCRKKKTTSILPIYTSGQFPEYLNRVPYENFEDLYRQRKVGKNFINGREYWVITEKDGDRRLVPIRTPSSLLFHHSMLEK